MDSKLLDILQKIKEKNNLQTVLKKLKISSYEDLVKLINTNIYNYIQNLRVFITRLFEICYDRPLSEFNHLPMEVLLFLVSQKSEELRNCYSFVEKNNIYLKLKNWIKKPLEEL